MKNANTLWTFAETIYNQEVHLAKQSISQKFKFRLIFYLVKMQIDNSPVSLLLIHTRKQFEVSFIYL